MKREHTMNRIISWIVVAAIVLVSGITVWNTVGLMNTMELRTEEYLLDASQQIAGRISQKAFRMQDQFEHIAELWPVMTRREREHLLADKVKQGEFSKFAVMKQDGKAYLEDGSVLELDDLEDIKSAWRGITCSSYYSEEEGILYTAPILREGKVSAVLIGFKDREQIQEILKQSSFGGEGISFVMDRESRVIAPPVTDENDVRLHELFEEAKSSGGTEILKHLQEEMKNRRRGNIEITPKNGDNYLLSYAPSEVRGWYVLTLLPKKSLYQGVEYYAIRSAVVIGMTILLFVGMLLLLLYVQKRDRKILEAQVFHEPLTKGISDTKFRLEARRMINGRPEGYYAVVSLDIREFKIVNEIYGLGEGNKLLKDLYRILNENLNEGELVSREKADYFYLLLENREPEEIEQMIYQAQERLNKLQDGHSRHIELKAGVYVVYERKLHIYAMQDRANVAKKGLRPETKEICAFYEQVQMKHQIEEKELLDLMEGSLENHEFQVYLQPKVDPVTRKVSGAEALTRWKNPVRGFIFPNEFIPVFEKNGMIAHLDIYVFEEVCRILSKWKAEGRKLFVISVNISRQHLLRRGFLDEFIAITEKYRVDPSYLELELTENTMFKDYLGIQEIIKDIHAKGFGCSLDDFGSGFSSLGDLKNLQVDTLKLDRSFFIGACDGKRGKYVVETVVNLARNLNIKSVAEGIETSEQIEFLKEISCDMIQGYVFSKPVPLTDFEELVFDGRELKVLEANG